MVVERAITREKTRARERTIKEAKMKKTSFDLFMILLGKLIKSGLPLVDPQPKLIWQKKKTAIVRGKKVDLSKFKILCDFGGSAYGFIRCKEPEKINLARFKALADKHLVSEAEREKLWPGAKELWIYGIRDWFPFEGSRKIRKAAGGIQTSIMEVVFKRKNFDPRLTAKELKEASDKELVSLHGQVHTFWEERGSKTSDELSVNCHLLIVEEMKRRGLEHRIQDGLDELAAKLMGLRIDENYVYIDDLQQIYGSGFLLKEPFLAAIGGTVVSGRGRDLDIWVNLSVGKDAGEKLLEDLEFRLRSFLNENLNKRIHLVPDPEGKFTSYIPLARLKVEFLKPEERDYIRMAQEIKPGIAFTPLKARVGYGRFSFYDRESLWKGWVQKYLLDP